MNPKFRTRVVARNSYANYLKRSDECFAAAKASLSKGNWNAAAICAIHSCISACDSLCIYFLGRRHSGANHSDAVGLLEMTGVERPELTTNVNRLRKILSVKNMAEYEERLLRRAEAESMIKDTERFVAFVRSRLPAE
ncbi:MAG: HEPN domain-containing protein [Candidatus Aminicenantales bacterium]